MKKIKRDGDAMGREKGTRKGMLHSAASPSWDGVKRRGMKTDYGRDGYAQRKIETVVDA